LTYKIEPFFTGTNVPPHCLIEMFKVVLYFMHILLKNGCFSAFLLTDTADGGKAYLFEFQCLRAHSTFLKKTVRLVVIDCDRKRNVIYKGSYIMFSNKLGRSLPLFSSTWRYMRIVSIDLCPNKSCVFLNGIAHEAEAVLQQDELIK